MVLTSLEETPFEVGRDDLPIIIREKYPDAQNLQVVLTIKQDQRVVNQGSYSD